MKKFSKTICFFIFIIIILESINYTFFNKYNYYWGFNQSCFDYDVVSGVKIKCDSVRFVKYFHGETIYDNYFKVNNYHFHSKNNFHPVKKTNKKRYLLFGDSFSAGLFLSENMPDKLQFLLDSANANLEIYNFSIDGGGIENWYSIFFDLLASNFEFDGIIFACFPDNLYRSFTVQKSDDDFSFFGRISLENKDNYKSELRKAYSVANDKFINDIVTKKYRFFIENLSEYVFNYDVFSKRVLYFNRIDEEPFIDDAKYIPDKKLSISELKIILGKKFDMLHEMIDFCQLNDKNLFLCSIPADFEYYYDIKDVNLKNISNYFDISFFDGYNHFSENNNPTSFFLVNDGHWNQEGSNYYAKGLFSFIMEHEKRK